MQAQTAEVSLSELNWENPVPENSFKPHAWINYFVPHFERILARIGDADRDPLTKQELGLAYDILDLNPQPESAAEANQRLRQFIQAVRKILTAHEHRQAQVEALGQRRRLARIAQLLK